MLPKKIDSITSLLVSPLINQMMVFNWFSKNNSKQLSVSNEMTDDDIIKYSDIEILFLNNSKITNKGLQHLTKSLKVIALGSCQITDDLLSQCTNLTDLALQNNNLITNITIQSLDKLEKLYLCNNTKITVESLCDKKLTSLYLGNNNNFDNESLNKLTYLIDLGIDRNMIITDDVFNYPNMKNLQSLDLEYNTIITGIYFDKLQNLTTLNIKNNDLINANALYKLPNLQNLTFNSNNYLKQIDYQLINLLNKDDYNNLLSNAIFNNNIKLVKYIINNNYIDKQNNSHLIEIALNENLVEIATYLITELKIEYLSSNILKKLIENGLFEIVKEFLDKNKFNLVDTIKETSYILDYVIKNNYDELTKLIFINNDIQKNNNYPTIYNNTIESAITYNNKTVLEFLLEYDNKTKITLSLNEFNPKITSVLLNDVRTFNYFNNWEFIEEMICNHEQTLNILQIIDKIDLSQVYQLKLLEKSVIYSNYLIAYYLLKTYVINLHNKYLLKSLQNDNQEMFLLLIKYYKLSPIYQKECLCLASQKNMTLVVENILEDDLCLFSKEMTSKDKSDEQYCMNMVIMNGNLKLTKLLANYIFLDYDNNYPLRIAVRYKHYDIVKFILNEDYIKPNPCINLIIKIICENKDIKMLELILNYVNQFSYDKDCIKKLIRDNEMSMFRIIKSKLKYVLDEEDICELIKNENDMIVYENLRNNYLLDVNYKNNLMLRLAAEKGYNNIIKSLMRRKINCGANNNEALIKACENNNLETVNLLLCNEKTDPSARNNEAIYITCLNNYIEIVERLLQDSRVDASCRYNICLTGAIMNKNYDIVKLLLKWYYKNDKLEPKELSMFELLFEKQRNNFDRNKINNTIQQIINFINKINNITHNYINKELLNDIYIDYFLKNELSDFEISIALNDIKRIYLLLNSGVF